MGEKTGQSAAYARRLKQQEAEQLARERRGELAGISHPSDLGCGNGRVPPAPHDE